MPTRVIAIAIDCADPTGLAEFWRQVLAYPEPFVWEDARGVSYVELRPPDRVPLLFQPVAEGKPVKNRIHLDIAPAELDQQAEVERLVGLGATVVADDPEQPWVVCNDPEGNEFCVLPRR
jgi:hypothetical protein